jgi:imidazolonepropionase-like amidohydrolase
VVPTSSSGLALADDEKFTKDARLKYLPASFTRGWIPPTGTRSPEDFERLKKVYRKHVEIVGQMRRAGVALLAGTDTLGPFCLPGFGLHDELSLLVQAGLTPMEALQSATQNPARFLGRINALGTVEQGKIADLVLLEANPLEDIRNTQKIAGVVLRGRLISPSERQAMLEKRERPFIQWTHDPEA